MILKVKPKSVDFWDNTGKMTAQKIKAKGGYDIVFNASFFNKNFSSCYAVKANGKVLSSEIYTCSTYGYGWNDGEIPRVMKAVDALKDNKVSNFVSAIWAILDGKPYPLDVPGGVDSAVIRTYMGLTADNQMIIGCEVTTFKAAQEKMLSMGCVSGIVLDGGGSSQLITDTDSITASRIVRTFICVNIVQEDKLNIIETNLSFAYNPGEREKTTHCILHHAAGDGSVQNVHDYHRYTNGWSGIAYHYYVRKDGKIYRGRPEAWKGGHCQNYNAVAIGICFEGNFDNENMTDAQLTAGQLLVADIVKRYPGIIVGKHSQFNATGCPGKNFPFTLMVNPVDGTPEDDADDADIPSEWAKEAWAWAIGKGITDGTDPQGMITREQAITMLWRAIK
jgi:hypothetical protein